MVEEGFPREVIPLQTLQGQACQVDEQRKGFWEDVDGAAVGTQRRVADHPLHLESQQIRLEKWGQPDDHGRDSHAPFPCSTSLLGSDLEGSTARCGRFSCLRLIYFIAGVPELLCWLQHIIQSFPPEQFFIFGNPLERDFGTTV